MNRNFYTNLKANNKMFYIGMFIILLSLVDVFINSFLRFNITFFLPKFFSIFLPKALIIPNKLWFKFGLLLSVIVSPIIMGVIFFLTVTPTGIIMRLIGKDLLSQKLINSKKSSWNKRKDSLTSMKNQF